MPECEHSMLNRRGKAKDELGDSDPPAGVAALEKCEVQRALIGSLADIIGAEPESSPDLWGSLASAFVSSQ